MSDETPAPDLGQFITARPGAAGTAYRVRIRQRGKTWDGTFDTAAEAMAYRDDVLAEIATLRREQVIADRAGKRTTRKAAQGNTERAVEPNIYERVLSGGERRYIVRMRRHETEHTETFDTLADAQLFKAKLLVDTALTPAARMVRLEGARKLAKKTTLAQLLDWYGENVTPLKKGAAPEYDRLNKLRRQPIAARVLASITPDDIFDLLAALKSDGDRKLADSSVYKYFVLLSHAWRTGAERGVSPHSDPCERLDRAKLAQIYPKLKGVPRNRRLLPGEETELMAALALARNSQLLLYIAATLDTGTRRSELLDAHWTDYDATTRELWRGRKRHASEQRISIPPRTAAIFEYLRTADVSTKYYHTHAPDPTRIFGGLTKHSVRSAWEYACERARITDLHVHDLRAEMITRMIEGGADIAACQSLSGHKRVESLMIYVRAHEENTRRKHDAVAAANTLPADAVSRLSGVVPADVVAILRGTK